MKFLVIACAMLKDELEAARKSPLLDNNNSYEVIYLQERLHQNTTQIRDSIEKVLADVGDYDTILMGYGFCGLAFCGLICPRKLVLPRYDDCISLLLASNDKQKGVFYLTPSWLLGSDNFFFQYETIFGRYGKEKALSYLRKMFVNYSSLCFIEQYAGQASSYLKELNDLSQLLNLPVICCSGSLHIIQKLLHGPWDDDFVIFEPGQKIKCPL
ncbi:MAG: DUF1638 domain-containing protein [Bacillota bacterium]|jgi:hypothetical protein